MNKKTKGLVSGALGAALMLGAGGTFALWFDTAALGAEGDSIATGNLALGADSNGHWNWTQVSNHEHHSDLLDTRVSAGVRLVPGDTVTYAWDSLPAITLTGDTLVANLYLDRVGIIDPVAILPLTLTVTIGGETATIPSFGTADQPYAIQLAELTPEMAAWWNGATDAERAAYLPVITLDFPINVEDDVPTPIAPGSYGAEIDDVLTRAIAVDRLQLRLQQVTN